jgi:beta-galactosidase
MPVLTFTKDQWWLSGIFRDVWLLSFPESRIEDFHVQTVLDDDYVDAELIVGVTVNVPGTSVKMKLLDEEGNAIFEEAHVAEHTSIQRKHRVTSPNKWTAETPYLYTLILSIKDVYISQKVGFRRAELIDGVFCVNGAPIKLRGVNRHEHHP